MIAYASEFGGKWSAPGKIVSEPNAMFDNKVWFQDHAEYHSGSASRGWVGKNAYDNALVGADVTMAGNGTLHEWQAESPSVNDVGSTYLNVPIHTQSAQIIAAARELLDLPAVA